MCFVPENNYRKFLKEEAGVSEDPGEICTEEGDVLARHKGIHEFTIGQKKGLGEYGIHGFYVTRIDAEAKKVIVGPDRSLFSEGLRVKVSYFPDLGSWKGRSLTVKIRSRSDFIPVEITEVDASLALIGRFQEPQRAVTPGQFAVFYQGDRVVGGGSIVQPVAKF